MVRAIDVRKSSRSRASKKEIEKNQKPKIEPRHIVIQRKKVVTSKKQEKQEHKIKL
jgi:hypothetical protein